MAKKKNEIKKIAEALELSPQELAYLCNIAERTAYKRLSEDEPDGLTLRFLWLWLRTPEKSRADFFKKFSPWPKRGS